MPISSSDCFSELFCTEGSEILSGDSPEYSSDAESPACMEESIAGFIKEETIYVPALHYVESFQSESLDASARRESVAWILKVQDYYGFPPLTAYLSVNYFDRFLCAHRLPQADGWPLQLLSVACLSLAAKMEEPLVPSLSDLQVEGAAYVFEPRTIRKMEMLVLGVLEWRLRSVTPFNFINFFAYKLDSTATFTDFLISRATEIVVTSIREASFLKYRPSCIAAASILFAAHNIPSFPLIDPPHVESWCDGLSKEKITDCFLLMQEVVVESTRRKPPKVLPHLRVTTGSGHPSSSSLSSSYKRRKLLN